MLEGVSCSLFIQKTIFNLRSGSKLKKIEFNINHIDKHPRRYKNIPHHTTRTTPHNKMSATKQIELAALEERIRITSSKIAKMQLQVDGWLAELPAAKAAAEEETRSFIIVQKPKKASAHTSKSTVYGAFSSKIQKEHIDAIKTFKEANPEMKAAHMTWVGNYKKEHAEEYATFKAAWDAKAAAAGAAEAAAGAAVVEENATPDMNPEHLTNLKTKAAAKKAAKKAEASGGSDDMVEKPKKVLSPEHLAKMKAGREAKAAAKKAAASIDDAIAAAAGELIYPSV